MLQVINHHHLVDEENKKKYIIKKMLNDLETEKNINCYDIVAFSSDKECKKINMDILPGSKKKVIEYLTAKIWNSPSDCDLFIFNETDCGLDFF